MMAPTIIECALRWSALATVVWLILSALRVRDPRLERSVWRTMLIASLAMPLLIELPLLSPVETPAIEWLQYIALTPVHSSAIDWQAAVHWTATTVGAALLFRHSLGMARWWKVRRTATRILLPGFADLDIRVTDAVSSPATAFSTILVPAGFRVWPANAQRFALAHERAHIESKDFYVQWLAHVNRCIFWFNPLAWWLPKRLALLSEHVSDDAATDVAAERPAYAKMLLGLAQRDARCDHVVAMAGAKSLAVRIERILSETPPAPALRWKAYLPIVLLLPIVAAVASFRTIAAHGEDTFVADKAAGSAARLVLPSSDRQRPLSHPMYPPASRLSGEQGTVVLKLLVLEDGSVADARIDKSSGYPDLDYAAYQEAFRWQLNPGSIDDAPSRMWGRFAVTFKLAD